MPGGVCAVLDYEVDMMAEYVAQMAIRVVTPEATVTPAFRKFVSQVLTSTRLPSTTILLGMNYLAKRVNAMKSHGHYKASEGQVWRYLTVALLLGSKFLDDNTFQNKSWSDVSGIDVKELNTLEREWVITMGWRLYVNLDTQKDYQAWLESWKQWLRMKNEAAAPVHRERMPLQPISTDISRLNSRSPTYAGYATQQQALGVEYERYAAKRRDIQAPPYHAPEPAWARNWQPTPITPPDSTYGTPNYAMPATASSIAYDGGWYGQQNLYARYQQPQCALYPSRHTQYASHYPYNATSVLAHGLAECTCGSCAGAIKQPAYFANHGYGTVMG